MEAVVAMRMRFYVRSFHWQSTENLVMPTINIKIIILAIIIYTVSILFVTIINYLISEIVFVIYASR